MPTLADLSQIVRPMASHWQGETSGYGPDNYGLLTRAKGQGYWGPLQTASGQVMTELSIGVPIFGQEMEIPTLVPTLTSQQMQTLLALHEGQPIPDDIVRAAVKHAEMRVKQGKNPFAQPDDTQRWLNQKMSAERQLRNR